MVRAAIVGLGWWGKTLVNAVQGKSQDIQFTVGCHRHARPRRRSSAARRASGSSTPTIRCSPIPDVDAVVLATPHSQHERPGAARRGGRQARVLREAVHAHRAPTPKTRARRRREGRHRARGRLQSPLPSLDAASSRAASAPATSARSRTASASTPRIPPPAIQPGYWRADPSETPAGAMTGIGIHTVDTHGRSVRPRQRGALHHGAPRLAACRRHDHGAGQIRRRRVGRLFFCSLSTVPNYRFAVYGSKGVRRDREAVAGGIPLRAAPRPEARPPRGGQAGGDPDARLRHAVCRADRLRRRRSATRRPIRCRSTRCCTASQVFEAIVNSAKDGKPVTGGVSRRHGVAGTHSRLPTPA